MPEIASLKAAIQSCFLSFIGDELLINCSSLEAWKLLLRGQRVIPSLIMQQFGQAAGLRRIIVAKGDASVILTVPLTLLPSMPETSTLVLPKKQLSQSDVIIECLKCESACGIVRMSDHKGLFSNTSIFLASNAHPNDWLGKKMSDFWIESELDAYIKRLSKDGELTNYSYVARLFSGENARLTVNARLVIFNGEIARMVETVSRELLV